MRRTSLLWMAAALVTSAGASVAADLSHRKPVPVAPVEQAFSWNGFYFGAQASYSRGQDTTKEYITNPWMYVGLQNTYKPKGFTGGVFGGGNAQYGNTVFGVEADVDFGRIKGGFVDPPAAPANPGGRANAEIGTNGSIRARLGYAIGPALIYTTAGVAIADHSVTYYNWAGTGESFSRVISGYTVGAGVEFAIAPNFTVRGEYRFTQFNLHRFHLQSAFPGFTGTQEPRLHTGKVGVAYRF